MTKMDYEKKEYKKTRTMGAHWYLTSYTYKYNLTHHKPFLEKLKDKKLVGLQCSSCNDVTFPPKFVCGKCLVKPDRWVDLRETATIATYTIAYFEDEETGEKLEKPVAAIRMDGSDTTFISELDPDIPYKDAYIGMPLKVHWAEDTDGKLTDIKYFDPIDDDSEDLELRKD